MLSRLPGFLDRSHHQSRRRLMNHVARIRDASKLAAMYLPVKAR